ncbi:MAG TPA: asparagine synthase-related protein [Candidatus Acidoferrales bacterium]|nr:asparagine synthase-related protein [Candidatus Acidoferrales bacterium]
MSGIVGIFRRNAAPVERVLLRSFTDFLSCRGPDGLEVWSDGAVGLGHAMLRTTRESLNEQQPASCDGQLWITADVRLDCRLDLSVDLEKAGRLCKSSATDPELLLQAYAAWGEECVQHLRGDFAFAIWDVRKKRLFCARDHFGIKPFFYAVHDDLFLFSNTLQCVRLHPEISDELNEAAIADFLLFGLNQDVATTTFRDIQRLPSAHFLSVTESEIRIERYWSPPIDGRIRYRRAEDYVEHFQSILQAAVADRLRTERVGIFLSGGLDSGAVAATARGLSASSSGAADLRAYTMVYESLFADREGEYARQTAEFLGIPLQLVSKDHVRLFERWGEPEFSLPEPVDDPLVAGAFEQYRMIASHCRVMLSGEGPDNLMDFQMWPYAKDLLRHGDWGRFCAEMGHFLWIRSFPWKGIRHRVRRFVGQDHMAPIFPLWIKPDFAKRVNLEDRWHARTRFAEAKTLSHPLLPRGHRSLVLPEWTYMFEQEDPGATHSPVEVRYPFLDLRIVNFLLALPPFPWFFQKKLLRKSMEGQLPKNIRTRPKTALAIHPIAEMLEKRDATWLDRVKIGEEMDKYVIRSALTPIRGGKNPEQTYVAIRPICLNFWLQYTRPLRYNLKVEVRNAQSG